MDDNKKETLVWDNIPEWAIFSLEYGIEEELFLTDEDKDLITRFITCLLYTSPSPRDSTSSRMPSSA